MLQNANNRIDVYGNGVTKTFTVPFYFLNNSHLVVYQTDTTSGNVTELVLNSGYTVTGAGVEAGGSITLTAATAPSSSYKFTILRDVPYTQLTHYVENDPFPAATHERALDMLTMQNQQQQEVIARAAVLPSNIAAPGDVPTPTEGTVLGWVSGKWAWLAAGTASLAANLLDSINVANGDALVAVKQPFTGAVATTQHEVNSRVFNVRDFGAHSLDEPGYSTFDSTNAVNAAIAAASVHSDIAAGSKVVFNPGRYLLGSLATITTPLILDFGGSYVYPNTTGVMFEIVYTNDVYNAERVVIRDLTLLASATFNLQPSDFFRVGKPGYPNNGQTNQVLLENVKAWAVTATHSIVWNYVGSGLTLRDCIFRGCSAPYAMHFADNSTDAIWSNAVNLDHVEVSAHTGMGLLNEGGDINISNKCLFEGCTKGGINFTRRCMSGMVLNCYFEGNNVFDVAINGQLYGGNYSVKGCFFGGTVPSSCSNYVGGISGTALTVSSVLFGTIAIGQQVQTAPGVPLTVSGVPVTIVSGSGLNWVLSVAPGTVSPGTTMWGTNGTATGHIIVSKPTLSGEVNITSQDNFFNVGGVTGLFGDGVTYVGINNTMNSVAVTGWYDLGWTSTDFDRELSDSVRGSMKATIINKYGVNRSAVNQLAMRYRDSAWTGATGSTPPTGWSVAVPATFNIVNSGLAPYDVSLQVVHNGTNNNPGIIKSYTTIVGKRYRFKCAMTASTPPARVNLGITSGGAEYVGFAGVTGATVESSFDFVAVTATTYVYMGIISSTTAQYGVFDEVTLYELSAATN